VERDLKIGNAQCIFGPRAAARRRRRRQRKKNKKKSLKKFEEIEIFRFLAEVNALSTDDGPLHWIAVFPSLVPVSVLLCSGTAEDCRVFRLIASGLSKVSFETRLFVPGTVLKKTSEYFVQWRDLEKGGLWGLNFISEDDALQFLDVCSMPQHQHSKIIQTPSTLSLYGPVPPQAQLSETDVS
jgi:hypothetical protein